VFCYCEGDVLCDKAIARFPFCGGALVLRNAPEKPRLREGWGSIPTFAGLLIFSQLCAHQYVISLNRVRKAGLFLKQKRLLIVCNFGVNVSTPSLQIKAHFASQRPPLVLLSTSFVQPEIAYTAQFRDECDHAANNYFNIM
jgi:hypothetical protein